MKLVFSAGLVDGLAGIRRIVLIREFLGGAREGCSGCATGF